MYIYIYIKPTHPYLPRRYFSVGVNSQEEFSLLVRPEGIWHDAVCGGREREPT